MEVTVGWLMVCVCVCVCFPSFHSASWLKKGLLIDVGFVCSLSWIWCLFMLHNRPQDLVFLSVSLSPCQAYAFSLCDITYKTLLLAVSGETGQFYSKKLH